MLKFISYFSKYTWNFEFVISDYWINKVLFCFDENNFKIIEKYLSLKIWNLDYLDNIFLNFWNKINHIWYDILTDRYKIYINLYNDSFEDWLNIISNLKSILNLSNKYYLEKSFKKFDCIWIDISKKWFDLKIYEIIDKEQMILNSNSNIKEIWFLKSFSWRKKIFYRFNNKECIYKYEKYFDLDVLNKFSNEIKDFYNLEKRVKYYCSEWKKREFYFV